MMIQKRTFIFNREDTMDKHAYLIVAHQCDDTFRTLLKMLDDPRNDIFIHMDKKNTLYEESYCSFVAKSKVIHTKRTEVTWGGLLTD